MKKLLLTTLIVLMTTANFACAATLSDSYVREEIKKQIIQQNKRYTDADLEVIIANMPFSTMYVPDGKLKFVVTSNFDKFAPRDIKKVFIYSNGKLAKEFIVSVRTLAYKDVLCARNQIERDSLLTSANVGPRRMEVSLQLDNILTPDMLNKKQMVSKKWFREGEIIDRRFVKIKPDVERNSDVQAYFNSNGVLIRINGKSMGEGMIGDYVNIQNQTYKRTYRGRVIGENKVLINI